MLKRYRLTLLMAWLATTAVAFAQKGRVYTKEDYAAAEKFLSYNVNGLVDHSVTRVVWLPDGRFWYRDRGPSGTHFIVMDSSGRKAPAFDETKIAAGLSAATGTRFVAGHLDVSDISYSEDGSIVTLSLPAGKFSCDQKDGVCQVLRKGSAIGSAARPPEVLSPDGTQAAFIRDWNLYVRDLRTNETRELTTDGVKDFGYATDNAGWKRSDAPIVVWSPDGKKIATFQQDERKTGDMYLVTAELGRPKLLQWKYPMTGDANVTMIERVIIDVPTSSVVRLKMPPDQHRSTNCDGLACAQFVPGTNTDPARPHGAEVYDGIARGVWDDVEWAPDSKSLAFVSTSRDHKIETLRIANAQTGDIRDVMTESVKTQFQSGRSFVDWRYLPGSNEVLWYSQRDNWGHLYLYDLATGKLKHQITSGSWNVTQLLHVDETHRELYFLGVGHEPGDPYFEYVYRIGFDGKGMTLLTPDVGDHSASVAEDNRTFIDTYSTVAQPPTTVLRSTIDGRLITVVSKGGISRLLSAGWVPPIPIKVKGRDGVTDIYGYMYRPSKFDVSKKYPIINNVYPGPVTNSCGARSFAAAHGDRQALAELGFIVVCIDGMGTPWRSKEFQDVSYGHMGDDTLPDQVAGMKDLARQFSYINLDRAGIWGHSGGGTASARAMFSYPDFFKVGISESGNHDNRLYEDDWANRWQGLLVKNADGTSNYDAQSNFPLAKNLKGKLLLVHGTLDDNVPPYETLELADALIKANKTFDLIMLPNMHHQYGADARYMMRRRWDYFVTNLMEATPPDNYQMSNRPDVP